LAAQVRIGRETHSHARVKQPLWSHPVSARLWHRRSQAIDRIEISALLPRIFLGAFVTSLPEFIGRDATRAAACLAIAVLRALCRDQRGETAAAASDQQRLIAVWRCCNITRRTAQEIRHAGWAHVDRTRSEFTPSLTALFSHRRISPVAPAADAHPSHSRWQIRPHIGCDCTARSILLTAYRARHMLFMFLDNARG
jgi:hypothetical protein